MTSDGLHRRRPFVEKDATERKPLVGGRSVLSCVKCHKTWDYHGGGTIVPTWPDVQPD